ncbi:hypothetical protein LQZ21_04480 [Treponema sp. TIM-1]|uniref:hypothetical protein n=1 Tax=Treponema sp. TIM-1 TaxID=2898417 RepID=UPI00397EBEDE
MLKKSLIFGSVALFLAALITLTGCPTSADDGSTEIVYGHRIYGQSVSPYQAQEAIDNAIKAREPVVLEHNLIIQGAGAGHPPATLNFKDADVRVNGKVTFPNGVINVADARVSWAPGAEIVMDGNSAFILRDSQKPDAIDKVDDGVMVEFVDRVQDIMSKATAAAVREFKLGSTQNYDYSTDSNGVDARITNPNLQTLYVVEKLTVPSGATPLGATLGITALGTVDFTGTIPTLVLFNDALNGDIVYGTSSTVTSSRSASVVLPDLPDNELFIPNVHIEDGYGITIIGENFVDRFTIEGKLTGPGTLQVSNLSNITITGGDGNITVAGAGNRKLKISSTGRAVFADNVEIPVGDVSAIYSTAVFRGDLTIGANLDLYGDVILKNGQDIVIDGALVTLGAGKTITLQITPDRSTQIIPTPLFTAVGGDVVLTGGNATFTTSAIPKNDPEKIEDAKIIELTGSLEITNGTLQVLPEATFSSNATLTTKVDGAHNQFGYLAVAEGGTLALGTNSLDIGDPVITAPYTFTASGGTINLGNNRITGSAPGTKLAPGRGSSGSITVAGATGTLILEEIELDVAAYSSIALSAAGAKVALDKGAKINLIVGENGQPTTWAKIETNAGSAQLTGAFAALTPDAAAAKQPAWSVAHRGGDLAEVNIVAGPTGITFGKSFKASFIQ